MRIVFMGTPRFAIPSLRALLAAGHTSALVVTQPDRPAGRGRQVRPSPVATEARARDLPLFQPESLRSPEALERIREARPDVLVVAAYGLFVPRAILELVEHRAVNVHPSLLPRHRGATPIQATLLAGDEEAGVTIIQLTGRMDAGPILGQRRIPILPTDDALTLEARLAQLGADLLIEVLVPWVEGRVTPQSQDESQATYCPRLNREDARLTWTEPAERLWRKVRAYRGNPDAYTTWQGRLLKVLQAEPLAGLPAPAEPGQVVAWSPSPAGSAWPAVACGQGALLLRTVMLEGKRATPGDAFLRGYPRLIGARLGEAAGPHAAS